MACVAVEGRGHTGCGAPLSEWPVWSLRVGATQVLLSQGDLYGQPLRVGATHGSSSCCVVLALADTQHLYPPPLLVTSLSLQRVHAASHMALLQAQCGEPVTCRDPVPLLLLHTDVSVRQFIPFFFNQLVPLLTVSSDLSLAPDIVFQPLSTDILRAHHSLCPVSCCGE